MRLAVPEIIGCCAVIIILLAYAVFLNDKTGTPWSPGFILSMAAALRALFLWRKPELSDDIYRYVFDGMMLISGNNPYASAPVNAMPGNPCMASLIHHINHADLPSIYPPAAQLVFAAGSFIGGIFGVKLVLVVLDLLSCIMIFRLLDKLNLPRSNVVLYAWHPLPVIEIAASGHIDGAAVFFLFASAALLLSEKSAVFPDSFAKNKGAFNPHLPIWQTISAFIAGIFFSGAVLSKWMPLIFLPGFWMLAPAESRRYAVYGFLSAAAVLICAFWPEVQNSFYTLYVYLDNWEFSAYAFRFLRHITNSGITARVILSFAFAAIAAISYFKISKTCHRLSVFKGFYIIALTFLLLTPTLHPWYALYVAAFLPFAAEPAGLVLSWSVYLAYRIIISYGLTGQWMENDFIPILIVSAPAAALMASTIGGMVMKKLNTSYKLLKENS